MNIHKKMLIPIFILFLIAGNSQTLAGPQREAGKSKTTTKRKVKAKNKVNKLTKDEKKGKLIFLSHCAACHKNGKNLAKPSRPVVGSATLATFATFRANLNKPLGNMPHYEHLIDDDKLLKKLYKYTKTLEKESEKENKKQKSSKTEKK